MQVNRYDTPAQAEFMNTYVPIPFEQMYTLGKQAKEDVDKALTTLSSTYDKWSDFRSPSSVDTQKYYDLTIGRTAPVVEKMASNIDYLKTAAGRAELYSALNNIDYTSLSNLTQSRDAMLAGQEYRARLAASGKYNPLWHETDFANYDTLRSDIFSDISPLAYTSIQELADPYISGIQDSFLYQDGNYDYFGVTPDQIGGVLDQNMSGIMATPEAQKHIEVFMRQNPGATTEDAQRWFRNKAYQDTQKYARINRSENRFALEDYKYRKAAAAKASEEADIPAMLTDQLIVDGRLQLNENMINTDYFPNTKASILQNGKDVNSLSGEKALRDDARLQFKATTGKDEKDILTYAEYVSGSQTVLENFRSPIAVPAANTVLGVNARNKVTLDDGSEAYIMDTSRGMKLPTSFVSSTLTRSDVKLADDDRTKYYQKFEKDLEGGNFKNVTVQSLGEKYTYVDKQQVKNAMKVRVSIPYKELVERGYKDKLFSPNSPLDSVEDFVKSLGGKIERGNLRDVLGSTKDDAVISFDAIREIPNHGNATHWINQQYYLEQSTPARGADIYPQFQERSYRPLMSGSNDVY